MGLNLSAPLSNRGEVDLPNWKKQMSAVPKKKLCRFRKKKSLKASGFAKKATEVGV